MDVKLWLQRVEERRLLQEGEEADLEREVVAARAVWTMLLAVGGMQPLELS